MTTEKLGDEGFRWFIGTVEDRKDPLKLGRVRVRIVNLHSDKKSRTDTSELPWASILNSPTSASFNKVGLSPTGIIEGSTVIGFFMDGRDGNCPVILGTLAGIPGNNAQQHDVAPEAREINSIQKSPTGNEPASAYKSKYPYNKVIRSESGHVIELDDTPGAERIHIYHKSGTYIEVNEAGRMVTKIADDGFEVVVNNKHVSVGGDADITVSGSVNIDVGGSVTGKASVWNITGDVNITGNLAVQGSISGTNGASVTGSINATGDVVGGGISLDGHRHPDAQGGSTGGPN